MKFGANTLIWSGSFGRAEFDLLPRIKEAGFDGVEIPIFNPGGFDGAAARRAIEDYRRAEAGGVGAIGRDGRLVDAAHMRHAENTLRRAGLGS